MKSSPPATRSATPEELLRFRETLLEAIAEGRYDTHLEELHQHAAERVVFLRLFEEGIRQLLDRAVINRAELTRRAPAFAGTKGDASRRREELALCGHNWNRTGTRLIEIAQERPIHSLFGPALPNFHPHSYSHPDHYQ